jgi:ribosome-associated toxin RatA of RatAB toxin-antitoxin module
MPTIDTTILIAAPLEKVYEIAKDNASYPDFMKDVQSVTVVERDGNRVVSDFVGLVPTFNLKVRWREEDLWDDATHTSNFRQLQGDYDKMAGTWSFVQEGDSVRFSQHLDYEYNVPTLGPLVRKVVHSLVIKNLENLAKAIKERAEKD